MFLENILISCGIRTVMTGQSIGTVTVLLVLRVIIATETISCFRLGVKVFIHLMCDVAKCGVKSDAVVIENIIIDGHFAKPI